MNTLYRFFAADGQLLYVGITRDPSRRFEKHAHEKPWWETVARIEMEQHASREALQDAERAAIQAEKPQHNIRMNGQHSQALPCLPDPRQVDVKGLVGRWFHTWERLAEGDDGRYRTYIRDGKGVKWQGQIVDQADDCSYLVQTYSWLDGAPYGGALLVTRDEMADWTFYKSSEAMQVSMGCTEDYGDRNGGRCHNPVTHVIRDNPIGTVYRCWRCIKHYAGKAEEL